MEQAMPSHIEFMHAFRLPAFIAQISIMQDFAYITKMCSLALFCYLHFHT